MKKKTRVLPSSDTPRLFFVFFLKNRRSEDATIRGHLSPSLYPDLFLFPSPPLRLFLSPSFLSFSYTFLLSSLSFWDRRLTSISQKHFAGNRLLGYLSLVNTQFQLRYYFFDNTFLLFFSMNYINHIVPCPIEIEVNKIQLVHASF